MFDIYENIKTTECINYCLPYINNPTLFIELLKTIKVSAKYNNLLDGQLALLIKINRDNKKCKFIFHCSESDTEIYLYDNVNINSLYEKLLYQVLTSIKCGYWCPDTFEEFCIKYGFNYYSISDLKTFKLCKEQSKKLKKIFTQDEIEYLPD